MTYRYTLDFCLFLVHNIGCFQKIWNFALKLNGYFSGTFMELFSFLELHSALVPIHFYPMEKSSENILPAVFLSVPKISYIDGSLFLPQKKHILYISVMYIGKS